VHGHLLRADRTSDGYREHALIVAIVSQGCFGAIVVWSLDMALDPVVRRRWPHMLISWTRLLSGRFGDPLIARDVLIGLLPRFALTLLTHAGVLVPSWFGRPARVQSATRRPLASKRCAGD